MYFIDELNGGSIYKYTPGREVRARHVQVGPTTSRPARPSCCASATATRRTPPAPTPGCRSPMRTARRCPAPSTITDINGVTSVDAPQHHQPGRVQGHRLPAPRGPADPDRDGRRVPVHGDDDHQRGLRLDLAHETISLSSPTGTRSTWPPARRSALRSPARTTWRSTTTATSTSSRTATAAWRRHLVRKGPEPGRRPDRSGRGPGALGLERHAGLGVHRPVLRPARQAPRLGQHPAPDQRQRPHDRDHDPVQEVDNVYRLGHGVLRRRGPLRMPASSQPRHTGPQAVGPTATRQFRCFTLQ